LNYHENLTHSRSILILLCHLVYKTRGVHWNLTETAQQAYVAMLGTPVNLNSEIQGCQGQQSIPKRGREGESRPKDETWPEQTIIYECSKSGGIPQGSTPLQTSFPKPKVWCHTMSYMSLYTLPGGEHGQLTETTQRVYVANVRYMTMLADFKQLGMKIVTFCARKIKLCPRLKRFM
jgi:hypothetical protein